MEESLLETDENPLLDAAVEAVLGPAAVTIREYLEGADEEMIVSQILATISDGLDSYVESLQVVAGHVDGEASAALNRVIANIEKAKAILEEEFGDGN